MALYYDERALEYDEIYSGGGPSFSDPDAYRKDVRQIISIAERFGKGSLIDLACGTGFWFPFYSTNCNQITLLDQSKNMLRRCRERVEKTGFAERCTFILGNIFEVNLASNSFDSAVIGFLLSHLNRDYEFKLFQLVNRIMKPGAEILLIDSAWSDKRSRYRQKTGLQKRVLNDGRAFCVPKRYFGKEEIEELLGKNSFHIRSHFFGDAFLAVIVIRR